MPLFSYPATLQSDPSFITCRRPVAEMEKVLLAGSLSPAKDSIVGNNSALLRPATMDRRARVRMTARVRSWMDRELSMDMKICTIRPTRKDQGATGRAVLCSAVLCFSSVAWPGPVLPVPALPCPVIPPIRWCKLTKMAMLGKARHRDTETRQEAVRMS